MRYTADICSLLSKMVKRWRGIRTRRKEAEEKKKELVGLDAMECRIKNAFIEVGINSSRIKKMKGYYELQRVRVKRERTKGYESLLKKYGDRINVCDRAVGELKGKKEDLKNSLEEIIVLKTSLKKEEVIDIEGRVMEIKNKLDEIMSRVEIYEEFPSDESY